MSYDSTQDTQDHIMKVAERLGEMIGNLQDRGMVHDNSKLKDPEKAMFDEYTPKLKELTYGSDEYRQALADLGPALQHHYEANSHHPEHYADGVAGMTLLDLVEMFADWKAASERHADGNFLRSLVINAVRFEISPQLAQILENTRKELGW